jgi:DNA-directed RNA polymerase II subunit RPB1
MLSSKPIKPSSNDRALDSILFHIPTPREVKNMASVEIRIPSTNVVFGKNHSLHDSRMGAFRNVKCDTCKGDYESCPGHMGYLPLCYPVLNPLHIKTNLTKILKTFCFKCYGNVLKKKCSCVDSEKSNGNKKRKLKVTPSLIKMVKRSYGTSEGLKIFFKWERNNEPLSILDVYNLISKIPLDSFKRVFPQFNYVDQASDPVFIKNLLVIPTASRPPNQVEGDWVANHLTILYSNILNANNKLRLNKDVVVSSLVNEFHNTLQNTVNILFDIDNTSSKLNVNVSNNGSIRQRIDGKSGRLRQNLMGKRVNFSARTVLSGDPKLGINEVGIPASIAENLTIPEQVNQYNLHKVHTWNIKYVVKDGVYYDASVNNPRIEIGDTVERSLINGDIVVVNRQPTLHRGSMLAVYVRIFQCSTFRLNYSTMITMNADTDGDEINLHVPQDLASRAELEELMLASTNIVCSQGSKPLVGLTQDSLLGMYLLSRTIISEFDFGDILYKIGMMPHFKDGTEPMPDILKPQRQFSGNRVVEMIMHYLDIYFDYYKNGDCQIIDNNIISGIMNKSIVGTADHSLIHNVYLKYDHKRAGKFIHYLQKAATAFLDIRGFSVGISDCIIEHEPIDVDGLDRFLKEDYSKNGNKPDEAKLCAALNGITQLKPNHELVDNRLFDMVNSGAKGKLTNLNQISRMVGQQFEANARLAPSIDNNTRTLPHFPRGDFGLESRGFVKNSYLKGLSPAEFFLHAKTGRNGIIDTACKTSETGSQQRRLVKSLENLVVRENHLGDRMVINQATGRIIQFNYGDDGLDGTYLKKIKELQ